MILLGLGLLAGCQAAPRFEAVNEFGRVRADKLEVAEDIAREMQSVVPRILELLPGASARKTEIWVEDDFHERFGFGHVKGAWGVSLSSRIHMIESSNSPKALLVHELVHFLLDASWATLPALAEEGLCEYFEYRLGERASARMDGQRLAWLRAVLGDAHYDLRFQSKHPSLGLNLDVNGSLSVTSPLPGPIDLQRVFAFGQEELEAVGMGVERGVLYGFGHFLILSVVESRGLNGLHELCLKATEAGLEQIPSAWLLEASGLGAGHESWRRALAGRMGEHELGELASSSKEHLVELLIEQARAQYELSDGLTWLRRSGARISDPVTGISVRLIDIPDVQAELLRRW